MTARKDVIEFVIEQWSSENGADPLDTFITQLEKCPKEDDKDIDDKEDDNKDGDD